MADDTNNTGNGGNGGNNDNQLTLTREEIAFLDAIIEAKREEERGSAESVTIPMDDVARARTAALVKAGKAAAKWVYNNWDKVYVATDLAYAAYQAVGGVQPLEDQRASRQDFVDRIKSIADPSLDELIELREQLEKQMGSKGGS